MPTPPDRPAGPGAEPPPDARPAGGPPPPPPVGPAGGPPPPLNLPPALGSTGSHRPSAGSGSLSDLLRDTTPGRRGQAGLAAHLGGLASVQPAEPRPSGNASRPEVTLPPAPALPPPDDDAPTVITAGKPAAAEATGVAGRRLGHFELIEAVGAGGMAAVLKARDLELGRVVALKILPPEAARDPENVTRFKHEARAAAKLDHDNVARVYFCGEDQGLHFIAFEFVDGRNLRAVIDDRGPLAAGECVRYMLQVAAGLAHASERGVVHRDIKPSNIIITPDGRAKIVDMGLARHLEGAGSVNGGVTQSGVTLGTFDYISPEQALDPRRADVRSDIYSLGCTFYHAATGRPPVPEGTAAKKLHAHQHVDPLDPRVLNPQVPDGLAVVLARMMVKDQHRRYQTPEALIRDLKGLADALSVATLDLSNDSVVRAVPAALRVVPDAPRLPLGWVAAFAALAALAAALVGTPGGSPDAPPAGPQWAVVGPATPPAAAPDAPPVMPLAAAPGGGESRVRDAAELARALADGRPVIRLEPNTVYDLTTLARPVVFAGPSLEIEGGLGTLVRVAAAPLTAADATARPPGTLTLARAGAAAFRQVRFQVVGGSDPTDADPPAGVGAVDVGTLRFEDCRFDAGDDALGAAAVGAVRTMSDGPPTRLALDGCLFLPGAVGVRLVGRVDASAADCAFAPQTTAAFHVVSDPDAGSAEMPAAVRVERSSFALGPRGAAVEADEAAVRVTAGHCVFAPAGPSPDPPAVPGMPVAGRRPVVLRAVTSAAARFDHVQLATAADKDDAPRRNVYYRVDPLGTADRGFGFDECKARGYPADDAGATALRQSPWESKDADLARGDAWKAFRLRLDEPLVYVPDPTVRLVGATRTGRGQAMYDPWPPKPPAVADARVKVWWPDAPRGEPLPPHTHWSLAGLLDEASLGDEILVRLDRDPVWAMKPVTVKGPPGFKLTVRPHPDSRFRPALAFGESAADDPALFRVAGGEVAFDGLEFRVRGAGGRDARAAAAVAGGRGVEFRGCLFTLEDAADVRAAAVSFPPDAADTPVRADIAGKSPPRAQFRDCLIRGAGRAAWAGGGRGFALDVADTLAVLDGPFLDLDPAGRDVAGGRGAVRLSRVTAVLGGALLDVQAVRAADGRAAGLLPLDVDADRCLFAPLPGPSRPLVSVDGADAADLDRALAWRTRDGNWYANHDPAASAVTFPRPLADDGMPGKGWNWTQWVGFARERGDPVGVVRFAADPKPAADADPADYRVREAEFPGLPGAKPGDAGADVDRLPKPAADDE